MGKRHPKNVVNRVGAAQKGCHRVPCSFLGPGEAWTLALWPRPAPAVRYTSGPWFPQQRHCRAMCPQVAGGAQAFVFQATGSLATTPLTEGPTGHDTALALQTFGDT